jgi:DNA invertase Pin-like site-specific DNA recombinase
MEERLRLIPAITYARVSTDSQVDEEIPITVQLDEIKRFAASKGFEIYRRVYFPCSR